MLKLVCDCGAESNLSERDLRAAAGQPFTCRACGTTRNLPLPNASAASPSTPSLAPSPVLPPVHSPTAPRPQTGAVSHSSPPRLPKTITCPDCGSDNCQSVPLCRDMWTAKSTQSNLAAKCAPPVAKPETAFMAVLIIGAFLTLSGLSAGAVFPSCFGAALTFFGYRCLHNVRQFNSTEWRMSFEAWRKKFICLKCGRVWIP